MKSPHTQRYCDESNLSGICGNEFPTATTVCPFCDAPQTFTAKRKTTATPLVTINLKCGLPTVEEAMARLDRELIAAAAASAQIIRIIHGWGSTGKGGAIRDEVRRTLKVRQRQHGFGAVVHGEDFSERSPADRQLITQLPQLRDDRSNFGNPCIMMVAIHKIPFI